MISIELEVSIDKKDSVSEKTTIILLTFLQERKEVTLYKGSIPYILCNY